MLIGRGELPTIRPHLYQAALSSKQPSQAGDWRLHATKRVFASQCPDAVPRQHGRDETSLEEVAVHDGLHQSKTAQVHLRPGSLAVELDQAPIGDFDDGLLEARCQTDSNMMSHPRSKNVFIFGWLGIWWIQQGFVCNGRCRTVSAFCTPSLDSFSSSVLFLFILMAFSSMQ